MSYLREIETKVTRFGPPFSCGLTPKAPCCSKYCYHPTSRATWTNPMSQGGHLQTSQSISLDRSVFVVKTRVSRYVSIKEAYYDSVYNITRSAVCFLGHPGTWNNFIIPDDHEARWREERNCSRRRPLPFRPNRHGHRVKQDEKILPGSPNGGLPNDLVLVSHQGKKVSPSCAKPLAHTIHATFQSSFSEMRYAPIKR